MRGGVGEEGLLRFEGDVLPRVVDARVGDLVDLEAQQVELPGPRPLVAPQSGELLVEPSALGPRRVQRDPRRRGGVPGEAVQRVALRGEGEQPLVGMLRVELGELATHRGQLPDGRQPPVDIRPGTPVGGQDPGQDVLGPVGGFEPALHPRLGGSSPDERRVGPPPQQQVQRLDEQRLARAGLAGDRRQPRTEQQREVVHDAQIAHVQLAQPRRHRSARPNFAFSS